MLEAGILPDRVTCTAILNACSHTGLAEERLHFFSSLYGAHGPAVLQAILTGCQIQGNVDFGIQAAKRLIELRPHREGGYVLLSNVYATPGRWNDVAGVRILTRDRGVFK
ncbi:hypothetical protein GOBAR_AA30448 [Gossypium barbadense]|uniref:Pentatricopeptide repeat-containing protein n=1 Tax=Gossypium barbadense TaxID=3634 RepID=A0A2P5WGK1_GOSBA|nr:hypothetical protein GOBAR_AA30448 [Gossypium barbadense]